MASMVANAEGETSGDRCAPDGDANVSGTFSELLKTLSIFAQYVE